MPADAPAPANAMVTNHRKVSSSVAQPAAACHNVASIFARAERVFERRVDQLLQAKRHKALQAGTPFNARKAKRDARTVAGREKLDALVRRLADLATVQENVLGDSGCKKVASLLDGAAAVLMGVTALTMNNDKHDSDCLETSSCSDDCSVTEAKSKDPDAPDVPIHTDRHIYASTESVVNFVLACDDDDPRAVPYGRSPPSEYNLPKQPHCYTAWPPCSPHPASM